jgi:hypothetical protein
MANQATTGLTTTASQFGSGDQRHKGMAKIALTMPRKMRGTIELPILYREIGFAVYLNVPYGDGKTSF